MSGWLQEDGDQGSVSQILDDMLDATNELIVAGLAEGLTHKQAGERAGVSAKTVQRRMQNPAFAAAVARRRRQRIGQIAGRLAESFDAAVDALLEVLASGKPAEQVRAAKLILDAGARFHTQHAVELGLTARLDALEGALSGYLDVQDDDGPEAASDGE